MMNARGGGTLTSPPTQGVSHVSSDCEGPEKMSALCLGLVFCNQSCEAARTKIDSNTRLKNCILKKREFYIVDIITFYLYLQHSGMLTYLSTYI